MNDDQLLRYSRQILLPDMDVAGQEKLLAARVMVIGLGGLGCPVALYLAAAGVGTLILNDDDVVDVSNLQRQIAHTENSVGELKVASAARAIGEISSDTTVETITERLNPDALAKRLADVDLVVDGTDNFTTRYLINQICFDTKTPLVSGAAIRWEGQVAVFDPTNPESPCYRCLYPDGDDEALNCSENGVIAPLVGLVGTAQAMETIKVLTGIGESLVGYLMYVDAKRMDWRKLKLPKLEHCPVCG